MIAVKPVTFVGCARSYRRSRYGTAPSEHGIRSLKLEHTETFCVDDFQTTFSADRWPTMRHRTPQYPKLRQSIPSHFVNTTLHTQDHGTYSHVCTPLVLRTWDQLLTCSQEALLMQMDYSLLQCGFSLWGKN